jgi:hypothetical protein
MTYKSISATDPWPDVCPDPEELSHEELLCILEIWPHAYLSPWERDFCESIHERVLDGRDLTQKQFDVLNRGLFRLLWDSDPALWEE